MDQGVTVPTDTDDWRSGSAAVSDRSDPSERFDTFVSARYPDLLRTAYLLTRDRGLAEDLVQTALVKTWPKWKRLHISPEAYVRKVMVNTYATWWRRRWRGEQPTDQLPDQAVDTGSTERTDLWDALRRLPPRQRAVIVLRFYEDLTESETAAMLDCSIGTVKSQTSKALAKLRVDARLRDEPAQPAPDDTDGGRS
jgi:RNA polymerase sigma-70 factor (sigma-E family)